jgi:hypothetical protein
MPPSTSSRIGSAHVALDELDRRIESPRGLDQQRRQVDPRDHHPPVVQVTGHVPRPAAQVAHDADRPHPLGEGVQELAVERLVCQFTGDPSDVLVGDPVVTGLNLTGLSLAHRYSSTLRPAVSDTSP